ncbi:MAG: hypothetical protein ACK6BG_09550, partial [Cyanobacteriota bacterium]
MVGPKRVVSQFECTKDQEATLQRDAIKAFNSHMSNDPNLAEKLARFTTHLNSSQIMSKIDLSSRLVTSKKNCLNIITDKSSQCVEKLLADKTSHPDYDDLRFLHRYLHTKILSDDVFFQAYQFLASHFAYYPKVSEDSPNASEQYLLLLDPDNKEDLKNLLPESDANANLFWVEAIARSKAFDQASYSASTPNNNLLEFVTKEMIWLSLFVEFHSFTSSIDLTKGDCIEYLSQLQGKDGKISTIYENAYHGILSRQMTISHGQMASLVSLAFAKRIGGPPLSPEETIIGASIKDIRRLNDTKLAYLCNGHKEDKLVVKFEQKPTAAVETIWSFKRRNKIIDTFAQALQHVAPIKVPERQELTNLELEALLKKLPNDKQSEELSKLSIKDFSESWLIQKIEYIPNCKALDKDIFFKLTLENFKELGALAALDMLLGNTDRFSLDFDTNELFISYENLEVYLVSENYHVVALDNLSLSRFGNSTKIKESGRPLEDRFRDYINSYLGFLRDSSKRK